MKIEVNNKNLQVLFNINSNFYPLEMLKDNNVHISSFYTALAAILLKTFTYFH